MASSVRAHRVPGSHLASGHGQAPPVGCVRAGPLAVVRAGAGTAALDAVRCGLGRVPVDGVAGDGEHGVSRQALHAALAARLKCLRAAAGLRAAPSASKKHMHAHD